MKQAIRKNTQSGFTLVEVIVVAIIVAALAAVAIPMYNGYVESSRNNAAANAAGSVASFMGSCLNQSGMAASGTVEEGDPIEGPATITCEGTTLTDAPSITVPEGITVTISSYEMSPGMVTGNAGGTDQEYSY